MYTQFSLTIQLFIILISNIHKKVAIRQGILSSLCRPLFLIGVSEVNILKLNLKTTTITFERQF